MRTQKNPDESHPIGVKKPAAYQLTDPFHTTLADPNQAPSAQFWINSKTGKQVFENTCPWAKTICANSAALNALVVIQIRCKRWACSHCGQRKMTHYGHLVGTARPNRLITLTVANNLWETPREAYDGTKRKVTELAVRLRRRFGEVEYFKVLEVTRNGWPHYHLVTRSEYIPQPAIKEIWKALTGAHIVDVRQIKRPQDVYSYVIKYLGKQRYVPWTFRRLSWSKHFFPPKDFKPGIGLELTDVCWNEERPLEVIRMNYHPFIIETYSEDCWIIKTDSEQPAGRPILLKRKKRIQE